MDPFLSTCCGQPGISCEPETNFSSCAGLFNMGEGLAKVFLATCN